MNINENIKQFNAYRTTLTNQYFTPNTSYKPALVTAKYTYNVTKTRNNFNWACNPKLTFS
jgi:hypothetical protein